MSCIVLLACYQGERFIEAQLHSLLCQTEQNFRILARDDGSNDRTPSILEAYQKKFPDKITLLPSSPRLGVVGNFNALLEKSDEDMIFFCDQDDVWEPNKIKNSLVPLKNATHPTLVHTDLKIVDEDLDLLHPSFWDYSALNPAIGSRLNHLLVQNHVTGCTMAINRQLKDLITPIPEEAIMHDWWISLSAAVLGTIISLPEKTVQYRQHETNVLGASQMGWKQGIKKMIQFLCDPESNTEAANLRQKQAEALYHRFEKNIPSMQLKTLKTFLQSSTMSPLKRKQVYITHQFYRQGMKKMIPYLFQRHPF